MTDRLLGTVNAGLDSSSEERLSLFQKILSDTLDDEVLQTLSGNNVTARELIRNIQRSYTEAAIQKSSTNCTNPEDNQDSILCTSKTFIDAKEILPNSPDMYISQEVLKRLAVHVDGTSKDNGGGVTKRSSNISIGTSSQEETARPVVKKRTKKMDKQSDYSDNAMKQEPASNIDGFLAVERANEKNASEELNYLAIEESKTACCTKMTADPNNESGYVSHLSKQCSSQVMSGGKMQKAENKPLTPQICGSCGNNTPFNQSGLCKNCWNKIQKEHDARLSGTLDDFKAYAKCIAQSVRKMLDIMPTNSKEGVLSDDLIGDKSEIEEMNPSRKEVLLHRCNTELPVQSEKNIISQRSASFDRKVTFSTSVDIAVDTNQTLEQADNKKLKKMARAKSMQKESMGHTAQSSAETVKVVPRRRTIVNKAMERSRTEYDLKKRDRHYAHYKNVQPANILPKKDKDVQNALMSTFSNVGTPVDPPSERQRKNRKTNSGDRVDESKSNSKLASRSSKSVKKDSNQKLCGRANLSLADVRTEDSNLGFKRRSSSFDIVSSSSAIYTDAVMGKFKPKEVEASTPKPLPKVRTLLPKTQSASSPLAQHYGGTSFKAVTRETTADKAPVPAPRSDRKLPSAVDKDDTYCDGGKHLPKDIERQLNEEKSLLVPVNVYTMKEPLVSKSSCQYFNVVEPVSSVRERCNDSKNTSSPLVNALRSSHSDESLLRSQADLYYTRKGFNGETDVDTGMIHHFTKRQNTINHVLPYHNFTSSIFTMSGDVSVSGSSNSGTSLKSEVSDIYTGGFLKEESVHDHDSNGDSISSVSSVNSVSQIYFEPVQELESNEHDIYTGGVFSTNQNANGSMNNSTRPFMNRVSRRCRGRPKIDRVLDRNMEITGTLQCKLLHQGFHYHEAINCSNNSSNAPYYTLKSDETPPPNPKITLSDTSSYTGFSFRPPPKPDSKPQNDFRANIDFSKYEFQETANTGFFFQSPKPVESDDVWYRGPYMSAHIPPSTLEQHVEYPSVPKFNQAQDDDDCYTNIICPKFKNSNNNAVDDMNKSALDENNNHFYSDDYTADSSDCTGASGGNFYEEASSKFAPQGSNILKSGVSTQHSPPHVFQQEERIYAGSQNQIYMSGFYGQSESAYGPPKSSNPAQPAHPDISSYSKTSSGYGRRDAESDTPFYSSGHDESWNTYQQFQQKSQNGHSSDYNELPRHKYNEEPAAQPRAERDNYFDYAACRNPSAGFFQDKGDDFSPFGVDKSPPAISVANEIKKVGGIVCRENVVNKEDYAEDVNRDLMDEPGAWVPFKYRDDEPKFAREMAGGRGAKGQTKKDAVGKLAKAVEESSYAHNQLYDNAGARNNWREMNQEITSKSRDTKDTSRQKQTGKDQKGKTTWRPPADQIPDRAMGKRQQITKPAAAQPAAAQQPIPPTVLDGNNNTSQPDTPRNPSSATTLSKCPDTKLNRCQKRSTESNKNGDESKQASGGVVVDEMVFISHPNGMSTSREKPFNSLQEPSNETSQTKSCCIA